MTIEVPNDEAEFIEMFLGGALNEIKAKCSVKEAEQPEIKQVFAYVNSFIERLKNGRE